MIIDLFAGPGGLDVGAEWLGVPALGIEFEDSAVQTRKKAGLSTIFGDVERWGPKDFDARFNVLTGGPPCQTFTVAGNGHGRRALDKVIGLVERLESISEIESVVKELSPDKDRRTGLVLQPLIWALHAIDDGHPYEAIMLEQVPAVKPVWEAMGRVLERHGYVVSTTILRTEEYGVPQTRRRAVLMARHNIPNVNICFPSPTHQKYVPTPVDSEPFIDRNSALPLWVSMKEVLNIGEDFKVRSNYGSGGDPKNRSYRQGDRPAFTVTGKVTRNKIVDPEGKTRGITPIEAGVLQTFPEDYPWSGNDLAQQVGNAIPPRLAAHVLNSLLGLGKDVERVAAEGGIWRVRRKTVEVTRSIAEGIRPALSNFGYYESAVLLPGGVQFGSNDRDDALANSTSRRDFRRLSSGLSDLR